MAKTNKNSGAFTAQPVNLAFWGNPSEATAKPEVVEKVKATRTKAATLRSEFNALVKEEFARTKFDHERLEFYLPAPLVPFLRSATTGFGHQPITEEGRGFLKFVKDKIYGALPDFNASATPEHVAGFNVNGTVVDVNISRETVKRQMAQLTQKIGQDALIKAAEQSLKDEFSPSDIRIAVCVRGNTAISRKLVASLMVIASELK